MTIRDHYINMDYRFKTFDKNWFERKQPILIYLLNHKLLKIPIRYLFGITEKDVNKREYISKITPNSFHVFIEKNRYRGQFYTNNIYSYLVYINFKQIWLLMHKWDELFADIYLPQLSFGFSTLIVYPDDDPETNTVDGYCGVYVPTGASYSTILTASGTESDDSATTAYLKLNAYDATTFDGNFRIASLFDTSALGSGASINSATYSVYGYGTKLSGMLDKTDTETVEVANTSQIRDPTSVLDQDYDNMLNDKNSYGSMDWLSLSTSAYNDITLNASGEALINDTGITYLGLIMGWDRSNSFGGTIGGGEMYFAIYTADYTTLTRGPKLTIDYGASSGGMSMIL